MEKAAFKPNLNTKFVPEFWEELKSELDGKREKPLKIKYHKKDDLEIPEKVKNFKRIFGGLPSNQTFEYEVGRAFKKSDKEVKAQGLEVENWDYGYRNFNHYWSGVRFLISQEKVENI